MYKQYERFLYVIQKINPIQRVFESKSIGYIAYLVNSDEWSDVQSEINICLTKLRLKNERNWVLKGGNRCVVDVSNIITYTVERFLRVILIGMLGLCCLYGVNNTGNVFLFSIFVLLMGLFSINMYSFFKKFIKGLCLQDDKSLFAGLAEEDLKGVQQSMIGKTVVLVGRSGVGKTTQEFALEKEGWQRVISLTTREKREGESNRNPYIFVKHEEILEMEEKGEIVEKVCYMGNTYALTREELQASEATKIVSVEPRGLEQLLEANDLNLYIVYLDGSRELSEERMKIRGDKVSGIKARLDNDDNLFTEDIKAKADIVINIEGLTVEEVSKQIKEGLKGGVCVHE